MRTLERLGARVLNGADVFALELSKSAQATLLRTLGIDTPRSITFNDVAALHAYADTIQWPAILKPDQGGSGARIHVVESLSHVESIFAADPDAWQPDNLFLLQEYLPHDPEHGIVRLEFLGGELLYAMRVKTHGRFNLCPSPVCNPDEGDGVCEVPAADAAGSSGGVSSRTLTSRERPSTTATAIVRAARLDVGGIEYLETPDGRRVFYDINANSNLRPSVATAFGFDPFERVVTYLSRQLTSSEGGRARYAHTHLERQSLRAQGRHLTRGSRRLGHRGVGHGAARRTARPSARAIRPRRPDAASTSSRRRSSAPARHSIRSCARARCSTRIEDWQAVAAVHGEYFGAIRPANTIMQVTRFIDPDWLIEFEADAVVEEDRR